MSATRINPGLLSQLSLDPTARLAAQAFGQMLPSMKQARQEEREKKEAIASANAYGQLVQNLPITTTPDPVLVGMLSPEDKMKFSEDRKTFSKLGDAKNIIITRNGVIIDGPVAFQPRGDGQYVNARGQTVEQVYGPGVKWRVEKTPGVKIENMGKDPRGQSAGAKKLSEKIGEDIGNKITTGKDQILEEVRVFDEALEIVKTSPEIFGAVSGSDAIGTLRKINLEIMNTLGFDEATSESFSKSISNAVDADRIKQLTMDMVRKRFEATKGSISNAEFEAFMKSIPNLLNTPQGYKEVIERSRNLARYAYEVSSIGARQALSKTDPSMEAIGKIFNNSQELHSKLPIQLLNPDQQKVLLEILEKEGFKDNFNWNNHLVLESIVDKEGKTKTYTFTEHRNGFYRAKAKALKQLKGSIAVAKANNNTEELERLEALYMNWDLKTYNTFLKQELNNKDENGNPTPLVRLSKKRGS